MIIPGRKLFYFLILCSIPFLLWVAPVLKLQTTFLLILFLFLVSRYWRKIAFFHTTLEIILLYLALDILSAQIGLEKIFPANTVVIILSMYFFLFALKKNKRQELFFSWGKTKGTFGIILLFSLLSATSLAIWFIYQPDNPYAKFIPDLPIPLLIPLGVGFAIINAIYEEGIFRSILLFHFSRELDFWAAIILQSIWFSFLHFQSGFPSGIMGIGLTFIFGLMMGYLVFRTKGILVPIIIHAFADFTIFLLVILKMQHII